jgi:cysteinyl-tRNA synthetase
LREEGERNDNTLSRKKEGFTPADKNIKMYACGITPYDEAHIGHAMQAIIFDTIRRYLELSGYNVNYIRNFTDVDDKIINRSQKEGVDPFALSARYIDSSKRDLARLKVRPGTHEPLVSEHIGEIVDFVKGLVDKGYAYEKNHSVYFDVLKFKGYGKLSGRNIDDLAPEEDANSDKRSPHDFALWKAYKEGEPSWDSPWGKGRPGWHIECSCLAKSYLGESIDIHGGGVDIIFPHHENEIAQSEALSGKPFARYWLHNGLVMVGKQKMSKSLGNFYTISDALDKYEADVLRYMILSFAYNSNCNFEETNLLNSEKRIYYFYSTLKKINFLLGKCTNNEPVEQMEKALDGFTVSFRESMDDNFNTAEALAALNDIFTAVNQYTDKTKVISSHVLNKVWEAIKPVQKVFSILDEEPAQFIESYKDKVAKRIGMDRSHIDDQLEKRNDARRNKDFTLADTIRNDLLSKGIVIMDGVQGSDWYYNL